MITNGLAIGVVERSDGWLLDALICLLRQAVKHDGSVASLVGFRRTAFT